MRMVIIAMTKARMAILNAAADLSLFNLCFNLKMTLLWLVTVFLLSCFGSYMQRKVKDEIKNNLIILAGNG